MNDMSIESIKAFVTGLDESERKFLLSLYENEELIAELARRLETGKAIQNSILELAKQSQIYR